MKRWMMYAAGAVGAATLLTWLALAVFGRPLDPEPALKRHLGASDRLQIKSCNLAGERGEDVQRAGICVFVWRGPANTLFDIGRLEPAAAPITELEPCLAKLPGVGPPLHLSTSRPPVAPPHLGGIVIKSVDDGYHEACALLIYPARD